MTTAQDYRDREALDADERHRPVVNAYRAGSTLRRVAVEFGISFQRVQQIVARARARGLLPKATPSSS